jgi:uncharacterized protein involved in exopolysaccharide biosynthesis
MRRENDDMPNEPPLSWSRRDLCERIFRHKKKVLCCPLAAIVVGLLVLLYFPRTYRSEAQVFLRLGRENIGLDPTATTGHTVLSHQADRKDEVSSVINVIMSRGVIAKAVDRIGVDEVLHGAEEDGGGTSWLAEALAAPKRLITDWVQQIDPISKRERAIVQVEKRLNVEAARGSTLISISVTGKSPQSAQSVCKAIVDVYQQEHMRIHRSEASRPFFAEQYERLRKQLDEALDALRSAKDEMGLSDVAQRRSTLEEQFNAVELSRLDTQQQLVAAEARVADLERQLANVPERLVSAKKRIPNSGADMLREQLYALQVKAMDLQARYNPAHPLVQAVDAQVKDAQRVLAAHDQERMETTDGINPIHRQLSLDLKQQRSEQAGLKAKLVELNQQKETVLAGLRAVNNYDLRIDQLSREAELARRNFVHYAENMEEARIDKELAAEQISNLSVVQPATLAERPVSPNKALVALATLVFATAGTVALIVTSELLNDRLCSEADISRELALPVLASIPGSRLCSQVLQASTNGAAAKVRLDNLR